jgi:hypothetical protein
MRAGFEVFRGFERDAQDFARFAQTPLLMPMLVLTGEKASGDVLIQQARLVATTVEGVVVRNSGHWLMEEAPGQVIPKLVEFLTRLPAHSRECEEVGDRRLHCVDASRWPPGMCLRRGHSSSA